MKKALWLILAGVGIGILLAPRKGSETWDKITDALDDLKSNAKDSLDDLKRGGKNMFREGKESVESSVKEW